MSNSERARTAANIIYNTQAGRLFGRLLDDVGPSVVHLHNAARQLSPSIVREARRRNIPVVITAHDYSLICPQGRLFKGDRVACETPNCVRGDVWHAVVNRCVKGSLAASTLAATEHLIHRSLGMYTGCERIIAPSKFLAHRFIAAGISRERIVVLPNGIAPGPDPPLVPSTGGQILFSGRIAREKGLDTLIDAAARLPEVPFVIAGDGPEASRLRGNAGPNVRFVGHRAPAELRDLLVASVAVTLPSKWYENAPISLLEAFRSGRPVIASTIGGHPEMLAAGGGILVRPGDADDLALAINRLWNDRAAAQRLAIDGRSNLVQHYSLGQHVDRLLQVYARVIAGADHVDKAP